MSLNVCAITRSSRALLQGIFSNLSMFCFLSQNVSLFIYDIDSDGLAHMVFTDDDTYQMISIFKTEAKNVADRYMDSWLQLKQGTWSFRIVDKKQIEIDTL